MCRVGSGNTPPANTDTTLVSQVAQTTTIQSYTRGRVVIGSSPITDVYSKFNFVYRFATGVAAGNLSEVGVSASTGNLYSRALILDDLGAPTTITVLPDEVLDVYYEHRLYYDLTDHASVINISGINYNVLRRTWSYGGAVDNTWNPEQQNSMLSITNITAFNGALSPITGGGPGGSTSQASSTTSDAYVPNSKTKRYHATWDLNSGNLAGGITAISMWATAGWTQMSFTPAIAKDATKTLVMDLDSAPWTRHP